MCKFVELTINGEKGLINVNDIFTVYNQKGRTYITTNYNITAVVNETYEEVKQKLREEEE